MTGSDLLGAALWLLFATLAIRFIIKRFVSVVGFLLVVVVYFAVARTYGVPAANISLAVMAAIAVVAAFFFKGSSTTGAPYPASPEVRQRWTMEDEFRERQAMDNLRKREQAESDERGRRADESREKLWNQ